VGAAAQPDRDALAAGGRRDFHIAAPHVQAVRAVLAPDTRRDRGGGVHRSAEGRAAFRRSLAALLDTMSDADGRRLVAACVAIYSAPFWQMLRDRGQLPARSAEDTAVTAMEAVITAARQKAAGTDVPRRNR
jgi:hypothetical protein